MANDKICPLTIPKWGLTMEEGTISTWLLEEGDEVEVETEVLEIATDKINQAVESPVEGILRRIIGEEGEEYPVKALIGIIAAEDVSDEEIDAFIDSYEGVVGSDDDDLEEDDDDSVENGAEESVPGVARKPMSKMRATIAKTVTASWSIPQFPVTMVIDMTQAKKLRGNLKATGKEISLNDIVLKACAKAIQGYPMANAQLDGNDYLLNSQINIAMAVAAGEDLFMPVIKKCESLSLSELAEASKKLVATVKEGSAGEEELSGGNFAVSNLGMFGVENFAALVPPGMAAILAVGGINDEAVVQNGEMIPVPIMRVTLMSDHRIVDGMYAANFLVELKRLLENPEDL